MPAKKKASPKRKAADKKTATPKKERTPEREPEKDPTSKKEPTPEKKSTPPQTPTGKRSRPEPHSSEFSDSSSEYSSEPGSETDPYHPGKRQRFNPTPPKTPPPTNKRTRPAPIGKPDPDESSSDTDSDYNRSAKKRRTGSCGGVDGSPQWDPAMPAFPRSCTPVLQAGGASGKKQKRKRVDDSDSDSNSDTADDEEARQERKTRSPAHWSTRGATAVKKEDSPEAAGGYDGDEDGDTDDNARIPDWNHCQDSHGLPMPRGATYCEECFEKCSKRYFLARRRAQLTVADSEFTRTVVASLARINGETAAADSCPALSPAEAAFVADELATWDANVVRNKIPSRRCKHGRPLELVEEKCPDDEPETPRCRTCGCMFFLHDDAAPEGKPRWRAGGDSAADERACEREGLPDAEGGEAARRWSVRHRDLEYPGCVKERGVCFDVEPCADWPMVVFLGVDPDAELPDTPLYILNRLAVRRNQAA